MFRVFYSSAAAPLFATQRFTDNHPTYNDRLKIIITFQNPRIRHQFIIFPTENMAIIPRQIITIDILIRAILLDNKHRATQL
ncbi:hypothetical protein EN35_14620 [Rhodococcus qingshengii]|nr:hypothetical protein EN35_14620 [Rhodococcus qingshengii]